ncbi:MAG TPA: class II glutamine amidotransferase, partial [Blastocatellia bacterium]|nr:class II glutamine amidotransferase [Blastocatellia bacterium]
MLDKLREECGVFGVIGHSEAARLTYLGLYALQHRGQESAGIVTSDGTALRSQRGMGHVSDIFHVDALTKLAGDAGIGHVRYSTAGEVSLREAQPFVIDCHRGQIAVCHNGNLPYALQARQKLELEGAIFSSTSDTEVVLHQIARSREETLVDAIIETFRSIEGAYSMIFLTPTQLIVVRDPRGFRPLALGVLDGAWVVASETCA